MTSNAVALDMARFCGEDLLPLPPDSVLGTDCAGLHSQQQPEYTPRSFHMYIQGRVCVYIYIYVCIYIYIYIFLTEIKCDGFRFVPLRYKLLGPLP